MTTVDPAADPAADTPTGPDARQIRVLKIVVIGLGILLLIGFGVVIARIAHLATQSGRGLSGTGVLQDINVALPSGAVVRNTTVSGDRLTVQFESPHQTGIVVINLTTGQVISRIGFSPETPR